MNSQQPRWTQTSLLEYGSFMFVHDPGSSAVEETSSDWCEERCDGESRACCQGDFEVDSKNQLNQKYKQWKITLSFWQNQLVTVVKIVKRVKVLGGINSTIYRDWLLHCILGVSFLTDQYVYTMRWTRGLFCVAQICQRLFVLCFVGESYVSLVTYTVYVSRPRRKEHE